MPRFNKNTRYTGKSPLLSPSIIYVDLYQDYYNIDIMMIDFTERGGFTGKDFKNQGNVKLLLKRIENCESVFSYETISTDIDAHYYNMAVHYMGGRHNRKPVSVAAHCWDLMGKREILFKTKDQADIAYIAGIEEFLGCSTEIALGLHSGAFGFWERQIEDFQVEDIHGVLYSILQR